MNPCTFGPGVPDTCLSPQAASWWTLPHCLALAAGLIIVFALTFIWPGPLAWLWDRTLGRLTDRETRMSRADAARWKSARTMADLGELVIAWLNGEIIQTPGHMGAPCDETIPLIPSLVILNRNGFVTDNSQLAESVPGDAWNTWVSGFASDAALERIREACDGTRLSVAACRDRSHQCARFGLYRLCPWRDSYGFWSDRCPHVADELWHSWYVVIEDPEPGCNDLLWPVLEKALAGNEVAP